MLVLPLCFLFRASVVKADPTELDEHSQKALIQTKQLLEDPKQREKAINQDADAKRANQQVKELVGGRVALTPEIYDLASAVFENVVKESHGDPVKMKQAMEKFQRDPSSFAESWTPAQKEKLHELSEKLNQTGSKP